MTPGALLFARYAYPPNALGYCGADEPRTLLEYGAAGVADGGLVQAARTFEGAWPYLELIAGANGLDDPLDPHVVEAYWVGNGLLDTSPRALARHVDERFGGRLGSARDRIIDAAVAGASRTTTFTSSPSIRGSGSYERASSASRSRFSNAAGSHRRRSSASTATRSRPLPGRSSGTGGRSSSAPGWSATPAGAPTGSASSPRRRRATG